MGRHFLCHDRLKKRCRGIGECNVNAQYNAVEAIEVFDELIDEEEKMHQVHLHLVDRQELHTAEESRLCSLPMSIKGSLTVAF